MELKRDRKSNVPFSLHDSRIMIIRFQKQSLILEIDKMFQYMEKKEIIHTGKVEFTEIDIDDCDVLVFDQTVNEGNFSGKAITLKDYIDQYSDAYFEILTEGYNGYCTIYSGWIWRPEKEPVSGIMNIWNIGDMIYKLDS